MKVIITIQLPRNGCLTIIGVTELIRRLAKITARLLTMQRMQPFSIEEDGKELADVQVEFALCATPSAEGFVEWAKRREEKKRWQVIPLPVWPWKG